MQYRFNVNICLTLIVNFMDIQCNGLVSYRSIYYLLSVAYYNFNSNNSYSSKFRYNYIIINDFFDNTQYH